MLAVTAGRQARQLWRPWCGGVTAQRPTSAAPGRAHAARRRAQCSSRGNQGGAAGRPGCRPRKAGIPRRRLPQRAAHRTARCASGRPKTLWRPGARMCAT
eukprot:366467-Chlamydomonas_euryale.AAC.10